MTPAVVEGGCLLEQEVCVTAGHILVQMHIMDWAKAQREDPILSVVLEWMKVQKQTDLKVLLAEHNSSKNGKLILQIDRLFNSSGSLVPVLNA